MAGIFNQAFGGGVKTGAGLAERVRLNRGRGVLSQMFANNPDFGNQEVANQAASALAEMGNLNAAVRASETPFHREQQALQRDFQNQSFQALQGHRDRVFASQQDQQAFQNELARLREARAAEEFAIKTDPDNPLNNQGPTFTTPIQGFDDEGNPAFFQGSNKGGARRVEGFTPATRGVKVDTGTHIEVQNPVTGKVISRTPKDNFQPSFDKAQGTAKGKEQAQFDLTARSNIDNADMLINLISDAGSHPGLDGAVGRFDVLRPNILQSEDAVNFRVRLEQLQGNAFLEAYKGLKGGGPITDIEGKKATDAQARLNAAQSESAMREALREMADLVRERKRKILDRLNAPRLQPGIRVPSPNRQIGTQDNPIGFGSEQDALSAIQSGDVPSGSYIIVNGKIRQTR